MNDIYKKGRRKEYKVCEELKNKGFDIVQRTAGSHSKIDIIAIKTKERVIKLIQVKRILNKEMKDIDNKEKESIERKNNQLNNVFRVEFEVF